MSNNTLTIQRFYNELVNNGVRFTHQFRLAFTSPVDMSLMSLYARGATVPGVRQLEQEIKYYAFPLHVPSNFEMDQDITFQVLCDANLVIRNKLQDWVMLHSNFDIENDGMGEGFKTAPDKGVQIIVDVLANDMETAIDSFCLVGAFPTNVGKFEVSHESAEKIQFEASFKFQYWKSNYNTVGGPGESLADRIARAAGSVKNVTNAVKTISNIL